MIQAAGILFLTAAGQVLLLKRSAEGDHAGAWCLPGGKLEEGETALEAALRETREETGFSLDSDAAPSELTRRQAEGVDFTTFLCRIAAPFPVTLDGEHTDYAWLPLGIVSDLGAPPQ